MKSDTAAMREAPTDSDGSSCQTAVPMQKFSNGGEASTDPRSPARTARLLLIPGVTGTFPFLRYSRIFIQHRKEPDMELVMGGLLVGVSGMLAVLIVAVWKDSASHRAETHPPQRRM